MTLKINSSKLGGLITGVCMNNTSAPKGLFRSGITDPKLLTEATVGRKHLLEDIVEKLKNKQEKRSGINALFIGPRGVGKTHLLSLIEHEIDEDEFLSKKYIVLRYPEESSRILSFADLLLSMVELLQNAENDSEYWSDLYQLLEVEQDSIIIDTVLEKLKDYHQKTKKVFVLMLENLDTLLNEQIKKTTEIHQVRKLLMDNGHIIMIATAPTYFSELSDVSHPLYDFFDIQRVEELTQDEVLSLIKKHLTWDGFDELLNSFDLLEPKIKAMFALTGGNPRLTMMLYELIVQDKLLEVKTKFQQLLDKITPFYQSRLKELSPQERALLETIALMRSQKRTPSNIAIAFRKTKAQTSVLLKRLTDSGYLITNSNQDEDGNIYDKRSRIYLIKEGFFNIWLSMNKSRHNRKYIPYLLDFFEVWYGNQQQRSQKQTSLLSKLTDASFEGREEIKESLGYISEISDDVNYFDKIIQYWKSQQSGDLEHAAVLFAKLRDKCQSSGLHDLHIALLQEKLEATKNKEEQIDLLLDIGRVEYVVAKYDDAKENFEKALLIANEIEDKKQVGAILNNISQIYDAQGDLNTALTYLEQSKIIQDEIGDRVGLCVTLFNMGNITFRDNNIEQAMDYWLTTYGIAKEINLAQVLQFLDKLAPHIGLKEGLASWDKLYQNKQ